MSGEEAWSVVAPMIYIPPDKLNYPESYDAMIEVYTLCHIGLLLYDNWVANGKPDEWREKPRRKK